MGNKFSDKPEQKNKSLLAQNLDLLINFNENQIEQTSPILYDCDQTLSTFKVMHLIQQDQQARLRKLIAEDTKHKCNDELETIPLSIQQIPNDEQDQDIEEINEQIQELSKYEKKLKKLKEVLIHQAGRGESLNINNFQQYQAMKNEMLIDLSNLHRLLHYKIIMEEQKEQENPQKQNTSKLLKQLQTFLSFQISLVTKSMEISEQNEVISKTFTKFHQKLVNGSKEIEEKITKSINCLKQQVVNLQQNMTDCKQKTIEIKDQNLLREKEELNLVQMLKDFEQNIQQELIGNQNDVNNVQRNLELSENMLNNVKQSFEKYREKVGTSIPDNFNSMIYTFLNILKNEQQLQKQLITKFNIHTQNIQDNLNITPHQILHLDNPDELKSNRIINIRQTISHGEGRRVESQIFDAIQEDIRGAAQTGFSTIQKQPTKLPHLQFKQCPPSPPIPKPKPKPQPKPKPLNPISKPNPSHGFPNHNLHRFFNQPQPQPQLRFHNPKPRFPPTPTHPPI